MISRRLDESPGVVLGKRRRNVNRAGFCCAWKSVIESVVFDASQEMPAPTSVERPHDQYEIIWISLKELYTVREHSIELPSTAN